MEGRGSPKLNYNKYDAAHNTRGALNLQKIVWEIGLQTSEKKTNCDKNDCGVIITLPLASCVPELEMAMKKISRRNPSSPQCREPAPLRLRNGSQRSRAAAPCLHFPGCWAPQARCIFIFAPGLG
jgi:hypothetical protein